MKLLHYISLVLLVNICNVPLLLTKVLIFTYAYNRPDFIEIQHKTFQKFLLDDYEFIVFNDAANKDMLQQITEVCKKLHIACIAIPQEIHQRPYLSRPISPWFPTRLQAPAVRNCNVVQYSLDTFGFDHDDILILIDSDMFLIKEFSVRDYLKEYELAGYHRTCANAPDNFHNCRRDHPHCPMVEYVWIALVFIDMQKISHKHTLNFNRGIINANAHKTFLDSGGFTNYHLQNVLTTRVKRINRTRVEQLFCENCKNKGSSICRHNTEILKEITKDKRVIKFIQDMPLDPRKKAIERGMELLLGDTFTHYKAGSNWNNLPEDTRNHKTAVLNNFIDSITRVDQ